MGVPEWDLWDRLWTLLSNARVTLTLSPTQILTSTPIGELMSLIESAEAWDVERKLEIARLALRCPPMHSNVSVLSGGEKRRVALCKLLLQVTNLNVVSTSTINLSTLISGYSLTLITLILLGVGSRYAPVG